MDMTKKLLVIAPDKDSGDAFDSELRKAELLTEVIYPKITPRVIGDTLNRSGEVEKDLSEVMMKAANDGYEHVAIACNTLQFYVPLARERAGEGAKKLKIYTTFDALEDKFPDINSRPVLLATTPTSKEVRDFPVPANLGSEELQHMVQEAVWRIKKIGGSDISTAFENVKNEDLSLDEQVKMVRELGVVIGTKLKEIGRDTAVLACTELPILFFRYMTNEDRAKFEGLTLIDPATVLAEYIKKRLKSEP